MRRIDEYWIEFNPQQEEKSNPFVNACYEFVDSVKGAAVVVFLVFVLAFRVVGVDGGSMNPTLSNGDWVAVSSTFTDYERGDIVIITQPWERNVPIIKRIIAVGGDTVDIDFDKHEVYVNGELIDEPYIAQPTRLEYDVKFPITVEDGRVFVMGDNRNDSLDSRSSKIGTVDERYIFGKAIFRIVPAGEWKIY